MKTYQKLFLALVGLGLAASLCLNWQRIQVERANKTIETVMEYNSLVRMAQEEGVPKEQVFKEFRDRGVTTLTVFDTSLDKLAQKGSVNVLTGAQLLELARVQQLRPEWQAIVDNPDFMVDALYISAGTSERALKEAEEDIRLRFGKERIVELNASPLILRFDGDTIISKNPIAGDERGVREMDLGPSTDELQDVTKNGFMVAIRPTNYCERYTAAAASEEEQINAFFRRLDDSGAKVSLIIGSGKQMLGNNKYLPLVAKKLLQRHITMGMVEGVTQLQFVKLEGMTELARLANYQVARTYVIADAEQRKMQVFDAFRRWSLADEERNIRVNYIKTFLTPRDNKTLLQTNLDYVDRVTRDVASKGFAKGPADIYKVYQPSRLWYIPMAFSLAAAWCLYFLLLGVLPEKHYVKATGIFGVLVTAGLFAGPLGLLARQGVAFGAAVIFPVLSMHRMMGIWRKNGSRGSLGALALRTCVHLFETIVLSLIGASMVGGILSDTRFLLEMDIYRGVKATFMLPVVLTCLLFLRTHGLWQQGEDWRKPFRRVLGFLNQPLNLKALCILGIFAFVAWVFIGRSGHTAGVPVPAIEQKLRFFLEETMWARPREKEFMIGHPAFFLAAWAAWKKLPTWFYGMCVTGAAIGQGSAVQTFAHMRSPILMSYVRALDGYGVGLVAGLIALAIFVLAYPHVAAFCAKRRNPLG
ncbi:DUF5693 family protein [uncultured Acidaminococcus sp.]|uniref:DUF5693 family protein n=1 Tax=uncultured Acidaminococcus sp. TaxID=352152 RepID=UPI002942D057|nr:DUF5693 family protein [uncultured Acidaminococcus sp.]